MGNETIWENSSKQSEFKSIIFALCFFHSVMCERRKFGPMGWNRAYPYNPGDLKDSIAVANNYLEGGSTIPWDDLRYLFGETSSTATSPTTTIARCARRTSSCTSRPSCWRVTSPSSLASSHRAVRSTTRPTSNSLRSRATLGVWFTDLLNRQSQ